MLPVLRVKDLALPPDALTFLQALPGPVAIEQRVAADLPWSVVSVLVHGNEPSGFIALHRLLRAQFVPAFNVAWIVSSVRAARTEPPFFYRHLPGEYDLNRRFGQHSLDDPVSALAFDIAEYIRERSPQWVLDIHNTSGRGPAFGVAVSDSSAIQSLVSAFADRLIITHLVVDSLMEQNFNCPVVTIECGGAADETAHQCAEAGLRRLLSETATPVLPLALYQHPVRVQLRPGHDLIYHSRPQPQVALTLRADIEQLNERPIAPGSRLGWLSEPLAQVLTAVDDQRTEAIDQLFCLRDGALINRQPMQLFMATPRADIAKSDCLFYVAR